MVLTAVLLWLAPLAALFISAVNLLIYLPLASGRGEIGRFFPQRPSRNVWTKVPAGQGAEASRRVVLMAHVDTTRAALLYAPTQLKSLRFNHMVNLISVVGLFVLALAIWAFTGPPAAAGGAGGVAVLVLRTAGSLLGAIALYGVATLVHREAVMPYVHGANDNASGVGLALAVGEHLAANPLPRTEVWCVVTGAEESGYPAGARRFIDAHLDDLRDADILILDNIGAGDLRHLTEEGIILPLKMSPKLLDLARNVGRAHPDWNVRASVCNLGYTDGTPAVLAGLRTLVLWAEGPDGFLMNYHWPTDTFEKVNPETVSRGAVFVLEMLEAIDRL
jgi:hypothetical protein